MENTREAMRGLERDLIDTVTALEAEMMKLMRQREDLEKQLQSLDERAAARDSERQNLNEVVARSAAPSQVTVGPTAENRPTCTSTPTERRTRISFSPERMQQRPPSPFETDARGYPLRRMTDDGPAAAVEANPLQVAPYMPSPFAELISRLREPGESQPEPTGPANDPEEGAVGLASPVQVVGPSRLCPETRNPTFARAQYLERYFEDRHQEAVRMGLDLPAVLDLSRWATADGNFHCYPAGDICPTCGCTDDHQKYDCFPPGLFDVCAICGKPGTRTIAGCRLRELHNRKTFQRLLKEQQQRAALRYQPG